MKLALLTHKLKLVVRSFFERLNIDFCSFFKMVNRVIKIEDAIAAGTCKVTFEFAHDETGGNRYNKCVIFDTDKMAPVPKRPSSISGVGKHSTLNLWTITSMPDG